MSSMLKLIFVLVIVLANLPAFAQQAVKPVGSNQAQLLPNPFSSADNIAAQTATFMHGGLMAWDAGGGNWDRVLLTAGALNVSVQNASLAVTGTFWQATQPVSGTVTADTELPAAAALSDADANPTAPAVGAFGMAWVPISSQWQRIQANGSGSLNVAVTGNTAVVGTDSDNAANSISKLPVLPCRANTSAPTWTDGREVPCSVQTDGSQRVAVTALPNEGQQTMANSVSVAIASDQSNVPVSQATAANLNMRPDTSGATAAAPPARANYVGGLASGATGGFLSGFAVCDSFVNVTVSTATTTLLVTGVSGRHVRICSLSLVTTAANNVALISGTGATCGTGTTGMTGGTTAATGYNFAANGGITQGNGLGTINQTNATGDSVCIVTSAATQLSGRIAYAIY